MKRLPFLLLLCMLVSGIMHGQGQYAGEKIRTLIGKKYNNDRVLPGLPQYQYEEVTLALGDKAPTQYCVGVFRKQTTYLVFFGTNDTPGNDNYIIRDVLIIKHVTEAEAVKTVMCRQNKLANEYLVAVTIPEKSGTSSALKAWRFNTTTNKVEVLNPKDVDCMNEAPSH